MASLALKINCEITNKRRNKVNALLGSRKYVSFWSVGSK